MSGILAVYALVISVLIASDIKPPPEKQYSLFAGFMHMGAGLSVGLSGLAAGYAIGIVGDAVGAEVTTIRAMANYHRVCAPLCVSQEFLSAWFSFSFSLKYWVSTGMSNQTSHAWRLWLILCRLIVALIMNTRASS